MLISSAKNLDSPKIMIAHAAVPDRMLSTIAPAYSFRSFNWRYNGTARQTVDGVRK